MTAPSNNDSELMDLLNAVWDDRLDADARERLEELLASQDFPAIELLTSFSRLHLGLGVANIVKSGARQSNRLAEDFEKCDHRRRK